jgi:hypothetical protein
MVPYYSDAREIQFRDTIYLKYYFSLDVREHYRYYPKLKK